ISASTHTISNSVKPRWDALFTGALFILGIDQVLGRDIGGQSAAAFLAVGAVGNDFIGAVLARRAIDVGMVPGVVRQGVALEVRAVPGADARGARHQRAKALRGGRKEAGTE